MTSSSLMCWSLMDQPLLHACICMHSWTTSLAVVSTNIQECIQELSLCLCGHKAGKVKLQWCWWWVLRVSRTLPLYADLQPKSRMSPVIGRNTWVPSCTTELCIMTFFFLQTAWQWLHLHIGDEQYLNYPDPSESEISLQFSVCRKQSKRFFTTSRVTGIDDHHGRQ